MQHSSAARIMGRQLGTALGIEHDRRVPRAGLGDAAVCKLACLAWQFEPHGLERHRAAMLAFVAGYAEGYRLAARAARPWG